MMGEFKPIQGYEGLYSISPDGTIYTHARHRVKAGPLRAGTTKKGYKIAMLYKHGKGKGFYVHRLVAKHFLTTNEKETVNHIDGDKNNNDVSNLEWATQKENRAHAIATGLHKGF